MLASLIDRPFDDEDWVFEIKWDGYRAICKIEKSEADIYSRNGISFNERFPQIVKSLKDLRLGECVLDGEFVVLDKEGRSSFSLLQNYLKTKTGLPVYYVFDLLYLEGFDLTDVSLVTRKRLLKEILENNGYAVSNHIENIRISGHLEKKGIGFFHAALKNGLEGIIAKRKQSIYVPGSRSRDWLKIKARKEGEFIICGYTEPKNKSDKIGSLITGAYKSGSLVFTGLVGGGLDSKEKDGLFSKLSVIGSDKNPFKDLPKKIPASHWVRPLYVIRVEFAEWTADNLFRQPVYKGLRIDKKSDEVVLDDDIGVDTVGSDNGFNLSSENQGNTKAVLTNPKKVFFPQDNITKKDLFEYYKRISSIMLPYITDRLQSLNRCPDGIYGECFYQKNIEHSLHKWLHTKKIRSESREKTIDYLVCTGLDSLLYMVNLGCIDIHPWSSRVRNIDKPDYAVLDLDPLDIDFSIVRKVARTAKEIMDNSGISAFCKTSGSKGIHIYIPLGARYTYSQALDFIKIIAKIINKTIPDITSLERQPEKRHNKVYLDCYQNKAGATVAAPYCVRPKEGAPVSTPLKWTELNKDITPKDFHINNIFRRLARVGDLWKGTLGPAVDIYSCLKKIQKEYKKYL
jgi:bifunctional non-homologous end joining protein LigD